MKPNEKEKAKRKGGRPKKGQTPWTPEVALRVGEMFLKGSTYGQMAAATGMDKHTIWDHVREDIQPELRKSAHNNLEDDLRRTRDLEQFALECYALSGDPKKGERRDPKLLELARWAIEHRAKIFAHYPPTRHRVETKDEVRIAGMSPAELDEEVMADIFHAINERRMAQQALEN